MFTSVQHTSFHYIGKYFTMQSGNTKFVMQAEGKKRGPYFLLNLLTAILANQILLAM